jgi:CDGSH-type Zn-finger protein
MQKGSVWATSDSAIVAIGTADSMFTFVSGRCLCRCHQSGHQPWVDRASQFVVEYAPT